MLFLLLPKRSIDLKSVFTEEYMEQADDQAREIAELRDRLSRLSQASLRINESLETSTRCSRGCWTAPAP